MARRRTPARRPAPRPQGETFQGLRAGGFGGLAGRNLAQRTPAPPPPTSRLTPGPTGPTPSSSNNSTPSVPGLGLGGPDDRNAFSATQHILQTYGLSELAKPLLDYARQGFDEQTSYFLIQQSPEWKQRFAGNELLKQKGMAELDPATYLDLENRYAGILKQAGIPEGQYGRSDFAQWIGNNVAPTEIQDRVQMAANAVNNSDPFFKQSLSALGIDTGHLTAYYLDQSRAEPYLQHQYQAAQIGAAALRNNLQFDPQTALALASIGITGDQAQQGYSQIAKMLPRMGQLAQITPGASFTQSDAEQDLLFGNGDAARRAQQLVLNEQARFAGNTGGVGTSIYHPAYGVSQPIQGAY